MTRDPKRKLVKLATATISTTVCVSILLGADLYLHHKHGINAWGYRGPALGRKQPGEKRVAVLGGSTTWGYGLRAGQDFPAQLQQMLANQEANTPAIKIVNLGFNNEGAYSFTQTLNDYDYLDFDLVVIYSGYNDLTSINQSNFRHRSPIFTATGYLPLLPALTLDKIGIWKQRLMGKTVPGSFSPQLNQSNESRTAETRAGVLTSENDKSPSVSCSPKWEFYCERIMATANSALSKGKRLLVVGEPYISNSHVEQQHELERMLAARFAGEPRLRYLNLGSSVDLHDPSLCWDGMHLTEEGNRRIAAAFSQPTLEMLRQ